VKAGKLRAVARSISWNVAALAAFCVCNIQDARVTVKEPRLGAVLAINTWYDPHWQANCRHLAGNCQGSAGSEKKSRRIRTLLHGLSLT
jgi:hypothetical protein